MVIEAKMPSFHQDAVIAKLTVEVMKTQDLNILVLKMRQQVLRSICQRLKIL